MREVKELAARLKQLRYRTACREMIIGLRQSGPLNAIWRGHLAAVMAGLVILSGCGDLFRDNREEYARNRAAIEEKPADGGAQAAPAAWQDDRENDNGASALPQRWHQPNAISIESREGLALAELADRLTVITGLDFVFYAGTDGKAEEIGPGHGRLTSLLSGSLPDVLDRIAGHYDLDWNYEAERIKLRDFSDRQYRVAALPARMEATGRVSDMNSSSSVDLLAELQRDVEMLAGPDAVVGLSPASGLLTVIARPSRQASVQRYMRSLNQRLSRRIAFDVNILTVSSVRSDSQGLDLDFLIGEAAGDYLELEPIGRAESGSTLNVGLVEGDLNLSAVVHALEQQGEVSVETRGGATTTDNRMAPIEVVRKTSYARTVETGRDGTGDLRTTIQPGTVTTGFEMILLPRLLEDGSILLRYNVQLSELDEMKEFTTDRQTIQLPELSTMSFEHETVLADRQTLVLAGFERNRSATARSRSFAGVFGLRGSTSSERVSTVLTIRPRLLPVLDQENG